MRYFLFALFVSTVALNHSWANELQVQDPAPPVKLKTDEGKTFDLSSRKGKWTVLYFYPKADTPGCTKQACTFRDKINAIRDQGADVFGVSADNVAALKAFKKKHALNFTLLADPKMRAIKAYGTLMEDRAMSKRWTFLINPELKIAAIEKDVDPVTDADRMAAKIKDLKSADKNL